MTSLLLDTNVLLRYVEKGAADQVAARETVDALLQRGDDLCVTPRVLTSKAADFAGLPRIEVVSPVPDGNVLMQD